MSEDLTKIVNDATIAIYKCQLSIGGDQAAMEAGKRGEHIAPFVLYQHIIAMADGVAVLISQDRSAGSMVPLLRSMFEAVLFLEYILEGNYEERSLSWFCSYIHKSIERYELIDPSTPKGKELLKTLGEEGTLDSFHPDPAPGTVVEKLNRVLVNELSEVEKKYKKGKDWYSSLDNGPSNIRELARHLHKMGHYLLLYRHWSSTIHASDASHFLTKNATRKARIPSPRTA